MANAIQRALRATPVYPGARGVYRALFRRAYVRDLSRRTAFFRQFVQPGSLCFDIGANRGNRTEMFLSLGARVVAVEPAPALADDLQEWFGFDRRFTLERTAVGAADGIATMYVSDVDVISTLTPDWVEACKGQDHLKHAKWTQREVPVTTLDRLIERHGTPDFVKIDVEGFEVAVLKGLSRPVRALSFEYTPFRPAPALECVALLRKLGKARYNASAGETFAMKFDQWLSEENCLRFCREDVPKEREFGDVYAVFDAV